MQKEKNFRVIDSIDNPEFANSKKLVNSNFYYSYSPNGCGKNNWVSYLFLIVNFKVKPVAYIDYKQCEGDEKGMYLYKFQRGTKLLIEKLDRKESEINDLEFEWKSLMNKIASP